MNAKRKIHMLADDGLRRVLLAHCGVSSGISKEEKNTIIGVWRNFCTYPIERLCNRCFNAEAKIQRRTEEEYEAHQAVIAKLLEDEIEKRVKSRIGGAE